jgi:hypothetical protein
MTACRKKQAETDLASMFPVFREAVQESVKWYWDNHTKDDHWMEARTRANLIRDRAANVELPRLLAGRPGVREILENQVKVFVIEVDKHLYSIKVKQMDETGAIAAGKTQASFDYNNNEPELPGLPSKAVALHLGAVPNITRRGDPEILLSCAGGDEPAWVIRLVAETPPPVTEIVPAAKRDTGERRVRVRRRGREESSR